MWKADLASAVQNAFDLKAFDRLLSQRLRRRREDISVGSNVPTIVDAVIEDAERHNWTRDLVREAVRMNPGNERLRSFAETYPQFAPARLIKSEVSDVQTALGSAFSTYDDLKFMVKTQCEEDLDVITDRGAVADGGSGIGSGALPEVVLSLIAWFDMRFRTVDLLEGALRQRPSDPVLGAHGKRILAALRARETASGYRPADVFDACLIQGRLFIDRTDFRQALKKLSQGTTKKVVAVNGPANSGKTYSAQLVSFVAAERKYFEVACIDLKKEQHAIFRPSALARSVARQMGRNLSVPHMPKEEEAGSTARWVLELCDWLVGEAKASGKPWVIVLDGFYHPDVLAETRDMVRELVNRAAAVGSVLRVVLLHYSDDLLPLTAPRSIVATEEIKPLTRQELFDFVKRLAEQQGEVPGDPDIDGIVDEILTNVPEADPQRIRRLAERLEQVMGKTA